VVLEDGLDGGADPHFRARVAGEISDHADAVGVLEFNEQDNVVQGIVQMTKGQNATKVVEALKERIEQLAPKLPAGIKIVPYYDRTVLVKHTVHTVSENLVVGALLVVAILILFLRNWYAALAVAVIIPLSLLFAFILIDHRGVSANLISLGAVDFGIITSGVAYQYVREAFPDVWVLKLGEFVPDSERWLHFPTVRAEIDEAIAWAEAHPPAPTDVRTLAALARK
jgi:hypothetical protein